MQIAGLQKTTLVDFPGKVAATVFLRGCNFRCGFCHNPEIVLPHRFENTIPVEDFFRFLESRIGKIQGVCITGGEPLLWKDTAKFISHIKALGFAVKLDTNGSYPERLEEIIKDRDLDYIAMDIKSPLGKYAEITNHQKQDINKSQPTIKQLNDQTIKPGADSSDLMENIKRSIEMIMNSGLDYEFRTTVLKPHHHPDDFIDIGKMIKGAKRYFIQNFVKSKHVDEKTFFAPFTPAELSLALANVSQFVESAALR